MSSKINQAKIALNNLTHYGFVVMFNKIEIELSNVCNRKCEYCPRFVKRNPEGFMSDTVFYKIIDELSELDFTGEIILCGYGEPLLDKRLNKFVSYIVKKCKSARINLYTNGDYLDYERFKVLSDLGIKIFTITQHEDTLSKFNKDILENARDYEREKINFRMSAQLYKINRGGIMESKVFEDNSHLPCHAPMRHFIVNWLGQSTLCFNDYSYEEVMGDINKESMIDIWKSKKYKRYRKELLKGNRGICPLCEKCDMDCEL